MKGDPQNQIIEKFNQKNSFKTTKKLTKNKKTKNLTKNEKTNKTKKFNFSKMKKLTKN